MSVDLHTAARRGDLAGVHAALCAGADPNAVHAGQTSLMLACESGHADIARLLIANGAQVDRVDTYNRTALHLACKQRHLGCCEVLMAAGARTDIESTLGGETPAQIVSMRGSIEMVRVVLYSRARGGGTGGGNSPLTISAEKKAVEEPQQAQPAAVAASSSAHFVGAANSDQCDVVPTDPKEAPLPPVAVSLPRRAPPPEVDEVRRLAPRPQRLPEPQD